jgi:hypothetical protein
LLGYAEDRFDCVGDAGCCERDTGQARGDAWDKGCGVRQTVHESEGVVLRFSETIAVVVCEEFGFVGGDVDIDGTLAFAGFARQA